MSFQNRNIWITVVLILLLYNSNSYTQKKSIRFHHYSMEEGLPQNLVDCILQDSKGFMWFGTWGGLVRFDGYAFKVYRQQTTEYSTISNNYIYSICEDFNGNIWVGTNNGINIYRYNKDIFQHFNDETAKFKALSEKITAIVPDNDSTLWIGTSSGLVHLTIDDRSSIQQLTSFSFGEGPQHIAGDVINHLLIDRNSNLWISTHHGVCILEKGSEKFRYIQSNQPNSISFNIVKSTFEDSDGYIWIATEFGVNKYDPDTKEIISYNADVSSPENSLAHPYVMSVAEDAKGNILIGTFGGLSVYKKEGSDVFTNYKENAYLEYSLSNDFINCIYKDKSGNIWIGTERGGINKYNSAKTEFEYFENEPGANNTLSNNVINSIYEDKKNIWIGTSGGGLNKYNKQTGKFKHYQYDFNAPDELSINNFISAIHRDKQKNLWIGSWGTGLYKLINENKENEHFINFRPQPAENSLINDYVSSIISDDAGNLWIGTYEGLDKFTVQKERFEHIIPHENEPAINRVGYLLFDNDNNLWIGTVNGLFKLEFLNREDYLIKRFTKEKKRKDCLSDNYVTTLYQDTKNNLWIGTYGFGMNKLISEKEGGRFEHYTMEQGLPNNIIYRILEDNSGNLWLTTDHGLSRFTPESNKFKNFFSVDGLQNNQYYWNAAFKNSEGKLFVGGVNGLNTFYPDSIFEDLSNYQGKVVITDLKIYNESVKPDVKYFGQAILSQSITTTKNIKISYKAREISFEFSALNYEQPSSIEYAYLLEGFESKWNVVKSNRRYARYTNLKPGKYIFKVRATNLIGEWPDNTTDIHLTIIPPFWSTWWFRISAVFVIITLLIIYNRYKIYSLKIQKQKLEKQVKERTAEIEDQKEKLALQNRQIHKQRDKLFELNKKVKAVNESKLKFFTNISHEFKTPLTLILGPIGRLLKNPDVSPEIKTAIDLVNKNTRRLLHLVNQLMDFRKLEHGKMILNVSKVDLDKILSDIIESFRSLSEQQDISLTYLPVNIEDETWLDFQKLENILYNLLSNAFKYTDRGGKIMLKVFHDHTESNMLTIEVSDTGVGIEKEKLEFVFNRFYQIETKSERRIGTGIGLALTKELVEVHKGSITVTSELGKGTIFTIRIPTQKKSYTAEEISEKLYESGSLNQQVLNLSYELSSSGSIMQTTKDIKQDKDRSSVLIVEDNDELRRFIADSLKNVYHVIEASNGKSGFELASSENPDVIVSDIMMPIMDGLELCKKVKSTIQTSHIPVLLLTAKGEVEDELAGLENGADTYMAKPFNFELLQAHIQSLIESRRKLHETFRLQKNIDTQILATTSTDNKFLQKILKIIDDDIDNPKLNVSFLAEKMLISRGHLHTKLISLANLSPIDFINNIRLKRSLELLNDPKINISEVAYSIGFSDPKYFSRLFKKHYGKSPSEYQITN